MRSGYAFLDNHQPRVALARTATCEMCDRCSSRNIGAGNVILGEISREFPQMREDSVKKNELPSRVLDENENWGDRSIQGDVRKVTVLA